jgi:mannosyl-3-phosphoglycerate phosphatase
MPSTTTTPKLVIFTDLDETLLDRESYSFEPARTALHLIKEKGIPLVLSSSKTRAEIEIYRGKMENGHPFIVENGGAVFIPRDYFSFQFPYNRKRDGYLVIELGIFYLKIIEIFDSIKKETGIPMKGFSDLTEKEIASLCGLDLEEAKLAKRREYDEPFIIEEGGEKEIGIVKRKIEVKGLTYTRGGRFHHILGKNDKGKAIEILKELYEDEFFSIRTVGIGDSLNDLSMLRAVDHPVFFNKGEGAAPEKLLQIEKLTVIEGTGPTFWNEAILNLIKEVYPCNSSIG